MRLNLSVPLSLIPAIYFGTAEMTTEKTVITYNMGLYAPIGLGKIPGPPPSREARRDAIIDELNNPANSADVVCLQEAYVGEDVYKIVEGVAATYPYSYSPIHGIRGVFPGMVLEEHRHVAMVSYSLLRFGILQAVEKEIVPTYNH